MINTLVSLVYFPVLYKRVCGFNMHRSVMFPILLPLSVSLSVPVDPALTELFRSVKLCSTGSQVHIVKQHMKKVQRVANAYFYTHIHRKLVVVWLARWR